MLKYYFRQIILILTFSAVFSTAFTQTNSDSIKVLQDSIPRYKGINPELPLINNRYFDYHLDFLKFDINNVKLQPGSAWLLTEMELQQSLSGSEDYDFERTDLMKPMYIKYQNEQELKTLKYILGMAQLSAVGYLAYLHVKKYGFR